MALTRISNDTLQDSSVTSEKLSANAAISTVTDQNAGVLKLWSGSQATYDGLTPDSNTIYFIV